MTTPLEKLVFNRFTLPYRPFYRRFPFRSLASIRSANDRGLVDLDLGIFFNRMPKAANSTVVISIARLKYGDHIPSRTAKNLFITPAKLSYAQMNQFDSLFKFTVVRNPYTRTLSAYLDKVERRAKAKGHTTSFAHFLRVLENGKLFKNAHWAPQYSLMLLPVDQLDFVGKMERLDRDLAHINDRIRPTQHHPVASSLGNATDANKKLATYYNEDLIAKVRKLYRADFDIFDYPLDFPA